MGWRRADDQCEKQTVLDLGPPPDVVDLSWPPEVPLSTGVPFTEYKYTVVTGRPKSF